MNNIEKVLRIFKTKPYTIRMGAKKLSKQFRLPEEDFRRARDILRNTPHKDVKILILDIETSPMKAWVWRRWKETVHLSQTIQEWFMLSWSGKWLGEKSFGFVLTPEEINNEDDSRILKELHSTLNEADIVIAHNGKKFDIPKINTRFILNNLPPTTPYRQIDTLEVAKKQFGFSSNSLDALATFFGFDNKDPHDFELWKSCLEGNREELQRLLNYNKKDVEILEKIYLKLRPWIKSHPNINVIEGKEVCPYCGASHYVSMDNKYYMTQHYKYPVFRCLNCGGIFRIKTKASTKKEITAI